LKLILKSKEQKLDVKENVRKIVFGHRRALGDGIMFSSGIRDFKLLFPDIIIGVDTNQPELFENNPYIDRSLKRGMAGVEYYAAGYSAIASANNTYIHFSMMFLLDMVAAADLTSSLPMSLGEFCIAFANGEVGDPDMGNTKKNSNAKEPFISLRNKYRDFCQEFSRQRGDLHLTEEEKKENIVRDIYKINTPYWVIAPGGKRDCTAKIWDWRRFQQVVDHFEGKIKFVVIGKSDLLVEPIRGTLSLVDKYNDNIRGLFSLIYNADGCVTGPSFLMHAAAAIPPRPPGGRKPCVTIFGGREPTAWSWYCNHQILHTNGAFSCCKAGGCWVARVYPVPKNPEANKHLCEKSIQCDGRTIQSCMDTITAGDVIRAVEKYYEGDLYHYGILSDIRTDENEKEINMEPSINRSELIIENTTDRKEINLLGNLHVDGGGEQSLCMLAQTLLKEGWNVNLYSWCGVHNKIKKSFPDLHILQDIYTFENGMEGVMTPGIPLLFYANDRTRAFAEKAQGIVEKSSDVIIGINYLNSPLTKCAWLAESEKVRAFIFQNEEKKLEFIRDAIGFDSSKKIVLFGAIDLDRFLEICTPPREEKDDLVILKHCVPDYRKYVTKESEGKGDKIHLWQKHLAKDRDTKFYAGLLKDIPKARFEFMEAHGELVEAFSKEPRMVFHKWDSMSVEQFLSRGHIYLYRTSNLWRDQYPRVVAEALAAGMPILTEPRDGTKDRVQHGNTGFYCVDSDGFKYALKMLERKEKYRYEMARNAKDWARQNLDPRKWVDMLNELLVPIMDRSQV